MLTENRLLEILCSLPPVHLDIIDLAWNLVDKDGHIDDEKLSFYYDEIEKAAAQAQTYTDAATEMTKNLIRLLH